MPTGTHYMLAYSRRVCLLFDELGYSTRVSWARYHKKVLVYCLFWVSSTLFHFATSRSNKPAASKPVSGIPLHDSKSFFSYDITLFPLSSPFLSPRHFLRAPSQSIIKQFLDHSFAQPRTRTLSRSPILHLPTTSTLPFSISLLYIAKIHKTGD